MNSPRVLGLVLLAAIGGLLVGARPESVQLPFEGPPPSSIVNLDSVALPSAQGGFVTVGAVAPLAVYDVPRDRWLLLTDCEMNGGMELVEIAGSTLTTKRGPFFNGGVIGGAIGAYHSSAGLAFAPGSQVAIRNPSGVDGQVVFTLTGHLVRQ